MASADDKSYDDINVTPMVDLYLVLLLIFIIMTTAGVQGTKVNLPKASAAANLRTNSGSKRYAWRSKAARSSIGKVKSKVFKIAS